MPSFLFIQSPFEARWSFLDQWRKPSYMFLLGTKSSEPPCLKGAVQIGMRGCAMQTSQFLVIELKANKLLSHFLVFTAYVINQHIKKQISVQKMMRISSQINHKVLRKHSMTLFVQILWVKLWNYTRACTCVRVMLCCITVEKDKGHQTNTLPLVCATLLLSS